MTSSKYWGTQVSVFRHLGIALVVLVLSITAAGEAAAMSKRCRDACGDEIAACIEAGGRPRRCRRQEGKLCKAEGPEACLAPSLSISARATGSLASTTLDATPRSDSQIVLSWVDTNGRETGYSIERSLQPTAGFQTIFATAKNATNYLDSGLPGGTTLYYRVRAFGRKGDTAPYSNVASATTLGVTATTTSTIVTTSSTSSTTSTSLSTTSTTSSTTLPGQMPTAPTWKSPPLTVLSCSQIRLDWNASSPGTYPIAGYDVFRWTGTAWASILPAGTLVSTLTYTESNLNASTTYYYAVEAVDTHGGRSSLGDWVMGATPTCSTATTSTSTSTSTSTTLGGQLPTAPTGLVATAVSCSQIHLSWNASSPGTYPIAGYDVYRWSGSTWVSVLPAGTLVSTLYYDQGGLSGSTTYYYSVEAVDTHGGRSGLSSWTSTATPTCSTATTSTSTSSTTSTTRVTTTSTTSSSTVSITSTSTSTSTSTTLNQAPVANAGPDQGGNVGTSLTFDGSGSTDPNGNNTIVTYSWTFGDGATGNGKTTTHAYANAGTYTATLRVQDSGGLWSNTDAAVVSIVSVTNTPPVANAGPDQVGVVGTAITLNAGGSYDPNGTVVSYAWNFGDGTTGSGAIVNHAYTTTGSYAATVTVTDNGGATASDTALVTVMSSASTGAFRWNRQVRAVSNTSWSQAQGVAVDSGGNVVVVGSATGTVDFGAGSVTGVQSDIFVVKYAPNGGLVWAKRLGSSSNDGAYAVAVDASNNIVVTGTFGDSIDLGGGVFTSAGSGDIFLAKFTSNGGHLWSKRFGGAANDYGRDVAIDGSGNIIVMGQISGAVDFGGGALSGASWGSIFVAKFTSSGTHVWSRGFSGTGNQYPGGVATDSSGNVLVAGGFASVADFGGGALTSAGATDLFVAKFAPTGTYLWARRGGGTLSDQATDVAVDQATGNITVTGAFSGTANFGGSNLVGGTATDVLVVQYSASGAHLWSKGFGEGTACGYDTGMGITVDPAGNIVLTGQIVCGADFGGGFLSSSSGNQPDVFVAKFSSGGTHIWSRRAGGPGNNDSGNAIVTASDGSVTAVGRFDGQYGGSIDFGGGPMTSLFLDAFTVQFAP